MKTYFHKFLSLPEKWLFLIAGSFNTLFGLITFTVLYMITSKYIHYIAILFISSFLSILVAFLSLKYFVFQTKGNHVKELVRCFITYLTILLVNSFLLYLSIEKLNFNAIASQFIITLILVICSFLSHKHFSFSPIKSKENN
jgi:putative flippase GtrA